MHGKFMWHLTENMNEGADAKKIEFQWVKSKF